MIARIDGQIMVDEAIKQLEQKALLRPPRSIPASIELPIDCLQFYDFTGMETATSVKIRSKSGYLPWPTPAAEWWVSKVLLAPVLWPRDWKWVLHGQLLPGSGVLIKDEDPPKRVTFREQMSRILRKRG